jgi:hypothetical protein
VGIHQVQARSMLEGAEGMFNSATAFDHHRPCAFHVLSVLINKRFMFPALKFFVAGLLR